MHMGRVGSSGSRVDPYPCTPLIVTSIISRLDPYSIEEMEALLLAVESRVEHCHNQELGAQGFLSQVQANFAHTHGQGFPARGRGRSGRGGRGRSREFAPLMFGERPQCQVCFNYGHSTWECYHRFNPHFQPHAPPQLNHQGTSSRQNSHQ